MQYETKDNQPAKTNPIPVGTILVGKMSGLMYVVVPRERTVNMDRQPVTERFVSVVLLAKTKDDDADREFGAIHHIYTATIGGPNPTYDIVPPGTRFTMTV